MLDMGIRKYLPH